MRKLKTFTFEVITPHDISCFRNGSIENIKKYLHDWYFYSICLSYRDFPHLIAKLTQITDNQKRLEYIEEITQYADFLYETIENIINRCQIAENEEPTTEVTEHGTTVDITVHIQPERCEELRQINRWIHREILTPLSEEKKFIELKYPLPETIEERFNRILQERGFLSITADLLIG